jgi:hypothetical protein
VANAHAFRHNGDDRAFTVTTEQPPQRIAESNGLADAAEMMICGEELPLFGGDDMLEHALALLEQDAADQAFEVLVHQPAHPHPPIDLFPRLVTIEVKKGEGSFPWASPDVAHFGSLNQVQEGPQGEQYGGGGPGGDTAIGAKQKRGGGRAAWGTAKKEKRAKCRERC